MTMLSAILTAVSIIELANKGYEWIDNLQSVIDKAYANALKRWAPNKGVRTLFAYKQFSTVRELSKYLIDKDSVTGEIQSLLKCFEEELKQNNNTYLRIIEILQRENLNISRNIQTGVEEIEQKVSAGFSQISLENQKTHKLLLSILEKNETKQNYPKHCVNEKLPAHNNQSQFPTFQQDINIIQKEREKRKILKQNVAN